MPSKPSKGKPRGRGYKSAGHTYGNCSIKRALIKQRVHIVEQAVIVQEDVLVTLMRDHSILQELVNDLFILVGHSKRVGDMSGITRYEEKKIAKLDKEQKLLCGCFEECLEDTH